MEIVKRINTSIDLYETLSLIMDGAKKLIKSEASSLMMIDHETKELYFNVATGEKGEILRMKRIPLDKGIAGIVANTGQSMIVHKAENDPRIYHNVDKMTKFSTRNLICVPLVVEGNIIGVLEVLNKIGHDSYDKSDLEALESFSEFAALAIKQCNLYQKMENKAYETSVLYRLCLTSNECDTINDLLRENIRIVCEAFQSERVSIITREGDSFVFRASAGISPKVLRARKVTATANVLEYMTRHECGVVCTNIHEDERFTASSHARYRNDSFMAVPMKLKGKIVAYLCVTERKKKVPYQQFDLRLLEMVAQQIMENYIHSQLTEEFKNKQKIEAELAIMAQMQQDILPREFLVDSRLDIAACNIPAKIVGGDFYDFLPLNEGKYGAIIADVSGKGVPAGLFMAISRSTIRVHFAHTHSPAKILELSNKHIFADSRAGMFVTCFCCILDTQNKEIIYANAGHYAQYLVKAGTGQIISLHTPGKPLGVFPRETFLEKKISYDPEDFLVLYTDGVTESVNARFEEYGLRRLKTKIRYARSDSADTIMKLIVDDINRHQGTAESSDDITIMIIKLKEPQRLGAKLRVSSQLQNVRVIFNEAERILKEAKASQEQVSDVLTSVDEVFANIAHHGYEDRTDGVIDIEMGMEEGVFGITFTDYAQRSMPDRCKPVLGGALLSKKGNLGVGRYLIQQLMDDVKYERLGNQNRLTIKKKIS